MNAGVILFLIFAVCVLIAARVVFLVFVILELKEGI